MKRIITLSLLTLITCFNLTLAGSVKCLGANDIGQTLKVWIDWDANFIEINDEVHRIVGGTVDGNGLGTEDFRSDDGQLVYNNIIAHGREITLNQYDAKTDNYMMTASLACKPL
tara:strand:+ start:997 stop:1338 length:342 start_codon:yes stop_codon:yes gene_type:complete